METRSKYQLLESENMIVVLFYMPILISISRMLVTNGMMKRFAVCTMR